MSMQVERSKTNKNSRNSRVGRGCCVCDEDKPASQLWDDTEPFAIRIINTITHKQTRLTITKQFTITEIQFAYAPHESHPEYYLWQDMFGKTLDLEKTLVENGVIGSDEIVEFNGIGKEPAILLVFKDGFENDIPVSLNPLHRIKQDTSKSLCRNY